MKNVFVTYNVGSESGENTALRLQTLSNLYGFSVDLPYRLFGEINSETKKRIDKASFVLSFSIDNNSSNLKEELKYADSINKPIVIAYDKRFTKPDIPVKGRNVEFFPIDFYDIDNSIKNIAKFLENNLNHSNEKKSASNSDDGFAKVLVALGIGLLAAWAISSASKED